jgi:hypoxanthine-guanine phosphoribosyltransferase
MRKSQTLVIKNYFKALHCWPEAPEEVSFLQDLHRHVFNVITHIDTIGDRQIEFFMCQTRIQGFLSSQFEGKTLGRMSCEVMAEKIGEFLLEHYDLTTVKVEVNEDGENGSIITLSREQVVIPDAMISSLEVSPPTVEGPRHSYKVRGIPNLNLEIADEQALSIRVQKLGESINHDFHGERLVIAYGKSSSLFVHDLIRYMRDVDVELMQEHTHYLLRSSFRSNPLQGKNILVCFGIVSENSALDLAGLVDIATEQKARSVVTAVLFDKTSKLVADYLCFKAITPIVEEVVGYGTSSYMDSPSRTSFGHRRCLAIQVDD